MAYPEFQNLQKPSYAAVFGCFLLLWLHCREASRVLFIPLHAPSYRVFPQSAVYSYHFILLHPRDEFVVRLLSAHTFCCQSRKDRAPQALCSANAQNFAPVMPYTEGHLPCTYISQYVHSVLSKTLIIPTTKSKTSRSSTFNIYTV